MKHGDNNTKFFRKTANARRRCNNIDLPGIDGESIRNRVGIKKEIVSFYQNLYAETEDRRSHNNMRVCPTIPTKDNLLQSPFEEQEIWPSVQACGEDKAHGPDGFTMAFFKHVGK